MPHQNTVFHSILKLVPWSVVDGANLPGYPTNPLGGASVTGAVTLLKRSDVAVPGNLYVPTDRGLFYVFATPPATASRYPLTGLATSPSAGDTSGESVVAVSSSNGAPVPGGVSGTAAAGFAGGNAYGMAVQ